MTEQNIKDILNPISKDIAFNYTKLWSFLISCIEETLISGADTNAVLTKQQIVDYLFKLTVVFDYNTGSIVGNFKETDGSRTAVDTTYGLVSKITDTKYDLIKGQSYYDDTVSPKRDIYSFIKEYVTLSDNPTFNSKLLTDYLDINLIDDVYIYGHETVLGEIPAGAVPGSNFTLANTDIDPYSVKIYVDGSTTPVIDDGAGNLSDGGTLNYSTGAIILGVAATVSITADYQYLSGTKFNDSTTSSTDIIIIDFWYYLLLVANFMINNDFHITFGLNSDKFISHNISNVTIPTEATIYGFTADSGVGFKIGNTSSDCNLSLTDIYGDSHNQDIAYYSYMRALYPLSYNGITTSINTDLTKRDFQNTKSELITFLGNYYPEVWNDFYDSTPGMVFLDAFAYMNDIVQNYIDRAQRESYPMTSEIPSNIRDWAYFAGVGIPGAVSASTQVTFEIDVSTLSGVFATSLLPGDIITIYPNTNFINENYYSLEKNGLEFIYFLAESNDNQLNVDVATNDKFRFTVTLKEGTFYKDTFTATGKDFESFTTTNTAVSSTNFRVFVNGVEKKIVTNFELLEANQSDADGIYTYNDDGKVNIVFGNESLGFQCSPGDEVGIVYLSTKGNLGNSLVRNSLVDETIDISVERPSIATTITGEASVLRNTASGGGSTVELSNKDMFLITLLMQSNNRLVTEDDYTAFIALFNGKNGGNLKGRAFLYQYDEVANIIVVPLLVPSGEYGYSEFNVGETTTGLEYPAVITELLDAINEKKMLTDRVFPVSGVVQQLKFRIRLELSQYLPRNEIEEKIKAILQHYFAELNFSESGKLSDLYYEIESLLRTYDMKNQINNYVKIYWQYGTESSSADPWREETEIEYDYDELTSAQQTKIKTVFGGSEPLARTQGDLITLFGIQDANISFNTAVLGYQKKKLLVDESI